MWKIRPPRLLKATIATLAALLMLKCGIILQAVATHSGNSDNVMVTVANAASTERPPESAPGPRAPDQAPDHAKPAPTEPRPVPSPQASEGPPPVSDSERALRKTFGSVAKNWMPAPKRSRCVNR